MKTKKLKNQRKKLQPKQEDLAVPLIDHLHELRKSLVYCAVSIIAVGTAAYFVQQHIVAALLWPAQGQNFIYTSVGGGINFLFRLCLYVGIAVSLPIIVYQFLRYVQPLLKFETRRFVVIASITSAILAVAGMCFGYFVGLPAALHFLLHQFTTSQIHPLLTINEYMQFVAAYMLGSAMLFQIPLILLFINRIKPLKPSGLWHYERWVILGSFIVSALMNPTPEIMSQLSLAGPIIVMYQVGIGIIWYVNRGRVRSPQQQALVLRDEQARLARQQTRPVVDAPAPLPGSSAQLAPSTQMKPQRQHPQQRSLDGMSSPMQPRRQPAPVTDRRDFVTTTRPRYMMDIRPPLRRAIQ